MYVALLNKAGGRVGWRAGGEKMTAQSAFKGGSHKASFSAASPAAAPLRPGKEKETEACF